MKNVNDPLLQYTMDDFNILNEDYILVDVKNVGKIKVEEFSVSEFYKYVPLFQNFIAKNLDIIALTEFNLNMMDSVQKGLREVLMKTAKLFSYEKARKDFVLIMKELKMFKCRTKKLMKNIKVSELCLLFVFMYYFNTHGVKKKLQYLTRSFTLQNHEMLEIFTTSYQKKVGSKERLPVRFPKSKI